MHTCMHIYTHICTYIHMHMHICRGYPPLRSHPVPTRPSVATRRRTHPAPHPPALRRRPIMHPARPAPTHPPSLALSPPPPRRLLGAPCSSPHLVLPRRPPGLTIWSLTTLTLPPTRPRGIHMCYMCMCAYEGLNVCMCVCVCVTGLAAWLESRSFGARGGGALCGGALVAEVARRAAGAEQARLHDFSAHYPLPHCCTLM
jgi:hypothetical protein